MDWTLNYALFASAVHDGPGCLLASYVAAIEANCTVAILMWKDEIAIFVVLQAKWTRYQFALRAEGTILTLD